MGLIMIIILILLWRSGDIKLKKPTIITPPLEIQKDSAEKIYIQENLTPVLKTILNQQLNTKVYNKKEYNCPNCGAVKADNQFCEYCGTKFF